MLIRNTINIPKQPNNKGREGLNSSKKSESFNGLMTGVDKLSLGVANLIENGGLAVSFTLQDMIGTNIPRPLMGLVRNSKENKGDFNLSFAAKELVREMLTGPSMFIIPGAMLKVAKPIFGKTINMPAKTIKALGEIHKKEILKNGQAISKQDFYVNAFTDIIKNAKAEEVASAETITLAKRFARNLTNKSKDKTEVIKNMTDSFINISKHYAKDTVHTDFTIASINGTKVPFKEAVNNIMVYADDVVTKAAKQAPDKITKFTENLINKKIIRRSAMNVAMFGSVLAFLQIIPKLYNKAEGKENAGLKGLMKEETLNDKSLENPNDKKANPSFGSAASFANKLTGNGLIGKVASGAEFSGCNLSFPMLLGVMSLGILFPRLRQAKDKYDREEILRRDLVTCTAMCFFEKILRKGFSKVNETRSGFVLAAKDEGFKNKNLFKRFFDYIRPEKGVRVLTSEQILANYSNIGNYNNGILGFCDFIEGQGGNLNKVFGFTPESKGIIENLTGKTMDHITNEEIRTVLSNPDNSKEIQDGINKLTDLFFNTKVIKKYDIKTKKMKTIIEDNPWVKKAKTLNARFTALSVLVLVPAFLGLMLPAINEHFTKKRIREEQANAEEMNKNNNTLSILKEEKNIFTDISNFEVK